MLGEPKLPFLLNDPKGLDQEFYSDYDERFLNRKINVLSALLNDAALLAPFVDVKDKDEPDGTERMRHTLAAEMLFTEFHQFESFFAMLIAAFQPLPHWIFLSTYSTREIKSKVRQFIAGEFKELSNGMADDRTMFLHSAVYSNCASGASAEVWSATMDNLWWIIHRMAEKYIKAGEEYNSYKHGLRIISASSTLAFSANQTDFSNAFVTHSPHSITHLKLDKVAEGTTVSVETKAFNPMESQAHVHIMSEILANIKQIRLAVLTGQKGVEMRLFSTLDRETLQKLVVCNRFAMPR